MSVRRKNIKEAVEKFSIVKTLQAVRDANVVVLVIDAREGVTDQDLSMLSFVMDTGRALVIALKQVGTVWITSRKSAYVNRSAVSWSFTSFARMHFISALHGSGVGDMYASIDEAYDSAMEKWVNQHVKPVLLEDMVADHQPPMVSGRRIKLRYAHQGGSNPPIIIVHGNQTDALPGSYKRLPGKTSSPQY